MDEQVGHENPAPPQVVDLESAIAEVLKQADIVDGAVKGIHQVCKAIETQVEWRRAKCVFLARNVNESSYIEVVKALCNEAKVPCIEVEDSKKLGQYAGLCKFDVDGVPRKIVPCGVVAVSDYGRMGAGYKFLQDDIKQRS